MKTASRVLAAAAIVISWQAMAETSPERAFAPFLDWVDGAPYYRGLPVTRHVLTIADRRFDLLGVKDAADLLDLPDYAERFTSEDVAPYGMELWPAARMLAEYLLGQTDGSGCRARRAIELGCGLGLVAIAATVAGWSVCATDNEPTSLRFTEFNSEKNNVALQSVMHLDWREPPALGRFDLVLAADVLYQLVDHEPLLRCVEKLLAEGGVALVADPNRTIADRFEKLATDGGFAVKTITTSTDLPEDNRRVSGRIFELTKR